MSAGLQVEIGHSAEKSDALDKCSPLYQSQLELAKLMRAGAVQIVRFRALSHMYYVGCPPVTFVGAFVHRPEVT